MQKEKFLKIKRYYLVNEDWINEYIQKNKNKVWTANDSQIQLLEKIKQEFSLIEVKHGRKN